jgi:hypothetical protein
MKRRVRDRVRRRVRDRVRRRDRDRVRRRLNNSTTSSGIKGWPLYYSKPLWREGKYPIYNVLEKKKFGLTIVTKW